MPAHADPRLILRGLRGFISDHVFIIRLTRTGRLGKYLSEQGLRYRMDKTEQEIATEGDYSLFEKLFGQTSNNPAKMVSFSIPCCPPNISSHCPQIAGPKEGSARQGKDPQ
jgi:hypothetical protein